MDLRGHKARHFQLAISYVHRIAGRRADFPDRYFGFRGDSTSAKNFRSLRRSRTTARGKVTKNNPKNPTMSKFRSSCEISCNGVRENATKTAAMYVTGRSRMASEAT